MFKVNIIKVNSHKRVVFLVHIEVKNEPDAADVQLVACPSKSRTVESQTMETVWNPTVSRWKPAGKVSNMKTWPNFFIVGALKAGTTSLYFYLKRVPGIYMSPVKEPHFFAVETWPVNSRPKPIRDEKKYLRLDQSAKA